MNSEPSLLLPLPQLTSLHRKADDVRGLAVGGQGPLQTDWMRCLLAPPSNRGPASVLRLPRMQSFTVDLLLKCVFYLM